jgi:hypothetical protein
MVHPSSHTAKQPKTANAILPKFTLALTMHETSVNGSSNNKFLSRHMAPVTSYVSHVNAYWCTTICHMDPTDRKIRVDGYPSKTHSRTSKQSYVEQRTSLQKQKKNHNHNPKHKNKYPMFLLIPHPVTPT